MKESEVIIERIRLINQKVQHLELAVDPALARVKPGQSLLARTHDTYNPYLPEQWWPIGLMNGRLLVERPSSERYDTGQVVMVLGLVGNPFLFRRTLRNVMLLAYDTAPTPLLMTIPWLLGNSVSVTLVLLGEATQYDTKHLPPQVEILTGDEQLNWANQVMTVGWADQVFAVVNRSDENAYFLRLLERMRDLRNDIPSNYLFGVFQPAVACAAGACHACMLAMREGTKLACTEGPAFDLTQVLLK